MPITITNHPSPHTQTTCERIQAIANANNDQNPQRVTIVHNVDGAQKKQLQHILRHTKHVMLNTGSTAIIAFTGRKTASDQLYVSCQNDFLRENSECFKRVGKKPGSDHYNQYTYSPISPL
ncbi:MAG: hypothetical protein CMF60_02615 [Magnetococcales bacterium]|jgi:thermostable 8-oxoguanine DNA glycosylase|nr:hypothetical protein [Magnetococcales bacterium]MEC8066511.1 hypothetical protein [Pseudomonadota bacterium]|tara:strand:- start:29504 stop:29866 length:363 start_codon:yes stop_codon:yes gene_type:complete